MHTAGELLLGLPLVFAAAAVGRFLLDLPAAHTAGVLAVYAAVAAVILRHAPQVAAETGLEGLGPANRVTLARLILVLPLALAPLHPPSLDGPGRWWVVALAGVALALDGVDGWLARRTGSGSAFGARFDMETDAALILLLSILVWQEGQAPAWIVLAGAMRYLFVAAGLVFRKLQRDLPPSLRRKVVCVVQGVTLVAALAPIVPPPVATTVLAAALAALTWSFAVDTAWLLRRGGSAGQG